MNLRDKIANIICFAIASLSFAAIFYSHISFVVHHKNSHSENENQALRVSHPESEHFSSDLRRLDR